MIYKVYKYYKRDYYKEFKYIKKYLYLKNKENRENNLRRSIYNRSRDSYRGYSDYNSYKGNSLGAISENILFIKPIISETIIIIIIKLD